MAVIKTDGSGKPIVVATVGKSSLASVEQAIIDLQAQDSALWEAVNNIQALGKKIGTVPTEEDLPVNTSELSVVVTANDYMIVETENAIYAIDSIDGSGNITWGKVATFVTDLSGKADVEDVRTALRIANRVYDGVDLTIVHEEEINAAPFNGDPWAWIRARIQAGNYAGVNVGDWIPMAVTGNTYQMQVAGIETYRGSQTSPAVPSHIDFISRELYNEAIQWNLAGYNNGLTGARNPFRASHIHAYLNSLQAEVANGTAASPETIEVDYRGGGIYDNLPEAVRNVITANRMWLEVRQDDTLLLRDPNGGATVAANIWLPSEIEVYGFRVWGSVDSINGGRTSSGSVQYPLFTNNMNRVKREVGTNGRRHWWLNTPRGNSSSQICVVSDSGHAYRVVPTTAAVHVPICFRVT